MRNVWIAVALSLLAAGASAATFTVTNTNDSGPGSLRQAIVDSNASGTPATIAFSIGSGQQTITPLSVLPFITNQVAIDATTQPGYAGHPLIRLDGSSATVVTVEPEHGGLVLHAAGSSVSGLSITSWRVLAYFKGSEGAGVIVAAPNCVVKKSYLGIALDGQTAAGNDSGVRLDSFGALIGGLNEGNVVGGNTHGIAHWRASGGANIIQGNIVGINASGTVPLPNLSYGIFAGGDANIIGNTVNHNGADLFLTGSGNIAVGNKIGYARSPGQFTSEPAILIYPGFSNTPASSRVGGPNPGDGNDVTGSTKGILLSSSSGSVIQGNTIHGNAIGVFLESSNSTKILGNTIANNSDTAIRLYTGDHNTFSQNSLYGNSAGIMVGFFYPLLNDPDDPDGGQNLGQNFPVITSAKLVNGQAVISGTLNSAANSTFTVEIFGSSACNRSGYGEGETFVGSASVITDASGNASFTVTSGLIHQGMVVTGTATDSLGNTSQFSACAAVEGAGTFSLPASVSVVEGNGSAAITVSRTAGTAGSASVSYATANGTATAGGDYTSTSGTLNFVDGEASKTITVPIADDAVYEGNETFTLQLTAVTSGAAAIGTPSTATVTITDNESVPSISIADARLNEGNSGASSMLFTVTLTGATTLPATVQYAAAGNTASAGSDFLAVSGTLTFNPGETQKTISVPIFGDTVAEPDETFVMSLFSPVNATIARNAASGAIVNDDAGPQTPATLSNVTPDSGGTSGNTLVKITGTNIASGCWPFFDGLAARTAIVSGPTEVIASTPAHATAGSVPVTLRCTGAPIAALPDGFTYSAAAEPSPVITTADPLTGSPGKSVTINGTRFRLDDTVTFDAVTATVLSTTVGTHIVRIPELPPGKTSITVTDALGRVSTTGPIFTIVEPQVPQITSVTPSTTRPSNEVTLDGSGFRAGFTFTIGDQPAAIVTLTYTRVVLRVPPLGPGSYEIDAVNAASKVAAGTQLNVLAAGLAVTSAARMCSTTDGRGPMTLTGSGFVTGATVTLDGVPTSGAVVVDAQTITLTLPPLPAGTPRVVVTNPNGDSASLTNAFSVISPFDPIGCTTRSRPARH